MHTIPQVRRPVTDWLWHVGCYAALDQIRQSPLGQRGFLRGCEYRTQHTTSCQYPNYLKPISGRLLYIIIHFYNHVNRFIVYPTFTFLKFLSIFNFLKKFSFICSKKGREDENHWCERETLICGLSTHDFSFSWQRSTNRDTPVRAQLLLLKFRKCLRWGMEEIASWSH